MVLVTPHWSRDDSSDLAVTVGLIRERHLATYRGDPQRVREDQVREAETVEAAYRKRQVIELIQNGADAMLPLPGATMSTPRGRIEVVLTSERLYCANEGQPLSRLGLEEGLLYSGLSPKHAKEIGRFGVGFKSVLAVTSSPLFLSRTISLSFSEADSRIAIEAETGMEFGAVPVLRLARTIDPFEIGRDDEIVGRLLSWAATIVVLQIDRPDVDWLSSSLTNEELPREFLLFSPQVGELELDDRLTGRHRTITTSVADGGIEIVEEGSSTAWTVRHWSVRPSQRARLDGGDHFGREEIDAAWAVPRSPEALQRLRQIWSFFPISSAGSSLPGILNSGWKLSADRSSLVAGELNEELLTFIASQVVGSLQDLADGGRPGSVVDLLPSRTPPYGEAWVGGFLRAAIWREAPGAEIVPSAAGLWHCAVEVKLWPKEVRSPALRDLRRRWLDQVPEPDPWLHESGLTQERAALIEQLGAKTSTLQEWLEALRADEEAEESANAALALASDLLESLDGPAKFAAQYAVADAMIVRTEDGRWQKVGNADIARDSSSAASRPHPRIADILEQLQLQLGMQADIRERRLLQLAGQAQYDRGLAPELWELVHLLGGEIAVRVLSGNRLLDAIPVRTISGEFRTRDGVLRPGPILIGPEDPALTVDLSFHSSDIAVLEAIGVADRPRIEEQRSIWTSLPPVLDEYERTYRNEFISFQTKNVERTPQAGLVGLRGAGGTSVVPSHLDVLANASLPARERFTTMLLEDDRWSQPWVAFHETQRQVYGDQDIPSPTLWAVRKWGAIPSTLGPENVLDVVAPELDWWGRYLPVARCSPADSVALNLPQRLEAVRLAVQKRALELAARSADDSVDSDPVGFIRVVAQAGWLAPAWGESVPELTTSRSQVESRRLTGHRTWLCLSEDLGGWTEAWGLALAPADSLVPRGEIEEFSLAEYLPAIVDTLGPEAATSTLVFECDDVFLNDFRAPFGRSSSGLYVSRWESRDKRVAWLVDELCPHLEADARAQLIDEEVAANCREILDRAREASTDGERLVAVLGKDGLHQAARELPGEFPLADARKTADALLTVYGPAALKAVAHLIPQGLGAPRQWSGGRTAVDFVGRLGFAERFAGRGAAERPDEEIVDGPVELLPLHGFQRDIASELRTILDERSGGVIDLPTGAGKTRVAIEAIIDWGRDRATFSNVLWVAEREELCEQAVVQWSQLWRAKGLMARRLRIHRYWGGRRLSGIERADSVGWVVVASRQQLYARLTSPELDWLRPADVLVIDEAHHSTAPTYLDIKRWRGGLKGRPSFACIGLSATPFRSDVERSDHLARLFDRSLVAGSVMGDHWKDRVLWLQTHEYIARVERQDLGLGTVPLTPDEERDLVVSPNLDTGIDRLNRRLGDDEARSRLLIDVVAKMPQNWPVIIFAASVGHAKRLAMLFGEKNISARPVWATLAQWARRDAIEAFRAGDVRVLTNYDVLAEGFDAPSTRAIVIGRLVRSDGLFLQMLGRGMRGPKNGGTDQCLLVTTGERLPERFDQEGNLDVQRHEWLWTVR